MALFTWWHSDPRSTLQELDGFRAVAIDDGGLLARLATLDPQEVQQRLASHNRPYVAYLGTVPVAYGWVALERATIGELGVQFMVPTGDRYLWDFGTCPAWRGRGLYPRLLQAILQAEEQDAERFWIISAPENGASQAGIKKAGFRYVGELSFRRGTGAALIGGNLMDRARVGAALLGVPLINDMPILPTHQEPLAPCWSCVIDARRNGSGEVAVACWPETRVLTAVRACTCGCK